MPRGDTDPSHYKAILPIYLKDDSIPKNADALIIVPEKVTYANDDRSIRPFILIKTDDKDHTQVSRVRKIWLAMIDIKNSHIIHINE